MAGTVPIVGGSPGDVAISRDGTRAYVSNGASNSISVIDTATDSVFDTIQVGDTPSNLAVTPDGKFLYVMIAIGTVQVVDTAQRTIVANIPVGGTGDIAITPDGARAYVAAGLVVVIDTATNVVIHSFTPEAASIPTVTNSATSVADHQTAKRVYVGVMTFDFSNSSFSAGGTLVVVDAASDAVSRHDRSVLAAGTGRPVARWEPGGVVVSLSDQHGLWPEGFFSGRAIFVIDTVYERHRGGHRSRSRWCRLLSAEYGRRRRRHAGRSAVYAPFPA